MTTAIIRRPAAQLYLDRPLHEAEIMRIAPSVYAPGAHESRSKRYTYIPTSDVITGLQRQGWAVYGVAQARCRTEEKKEHTKHMLRLRHADTLANTGREMGPGQHIISHDVNEIIVLNSHDGSSAYKCYGGRFRSICTNGLIVPETVLQDITVRHSGNVVQDVIQSAFQLMDDFQRIDGSVDAMKARVLQPYEAEAFAKAAIAMRFDADNLDDAPVTPRQVLQARRWQDEDADLWKTFNRVQENLVEGGLHGRRGRAHVTTRAVRGIEGNTALNRGLWTLAEALRAGAAQA